MAGGGLGAVGALKSGNNAFAAGNYNAAAAEAEALDALKRGSGEERRYSRDLAQLTGEQRAEAGARNVTRSGTALDIVEDTSAIGEEDLMMIRNNAAREAFGLRSQASEMRRQGRGARRQSRMAAGGTVLTSGARAYGYGWDK